MGIENDFSGVLAPAVLRILYDLREKSADPERRAQNEARVRAAFESDRETLVSRSGIPKRYRNSDFDNFIVTTENAPALKACREYVENWAEAPGVEGMALFGDIGVGKTHLAIAVMRELIHKHLVPAKYANLLHTFERAKWSFESDGVNPIPLLLDCPFLVLDDLGSERPTTWTLSQVLLIVDYRLGEELPMFITSNALGWDGLAKMLNVEVKGDHESRAHMILPVNRAIDRLSEIVGDPIAIRGESWRGRDKGGDHVDQS